MALLDMSTANARVKNYDRSEGLAIGYANARLKTRKRMREIQRIHSELNKSGFKVINWTNDYAVGAIPEIDSTQEITAWQKLPEVESIKTEGGETFYPTPAQRSWTYLLIVLFPVAGFFVPWSAVRALGWAVAGLLQQPRKVD